MTATNPGEQAASETAGMGSSNLSPMTSPAPSKLHSQFQTALSVFGKPWAVSNLELLPVWVSDPILWALFLLGIPGVLHSCLFKEGSLALS